MTILLRIGLLKKFQDFKHAFSYMVKISENLEYIYLKKVWKKYRNFTDAGSIHHATKNGKNKTRWQKKRGMRLRLQTNFFIEKKNEKYIFSLI